MLSDTITKNNVNSLDPQENPFIVIKDQMKAVETSLRQAPPDQQDWLVRESERILNAGGKRIRPAIALLVSEIFKSDPERAISLSAGIEMLHSATLVHDDLIDKANTRRGVPTTNAVWSSDAAILMGDYLFARAAELVAQADSVRIMYLFAHTLMVILNGEIAQRATRWSFDRNEYLRRIFSKTAVVFVLAAQAAAVLGKADLSQEQALIEFGRSSGMAFQIVDDILDYTGSPKHLGKPIGGDLHQGILTLPAIHYYEDNPDDPDMHWLLESKQNNPEIISRLLRKIRSSPAIQSSFKEAKQMAINAKIELEKLPSSRYRQSLICITNSVVERDF